MFPQQCFTFMKTCCKLIIHGKASPFHGLCALVYPRRTQEHTKTARCIMTSACQRVSRGREDSMLRDILHVSSPYSSSSFSSSSSSPSAAALFRKVLPTLVKQIHPDLFGTYDDSVRRKNLLCTQTLNEFWFALGDIVLGSTFKAGSKNDDEKVQVQIPLKSRYHLKCALKTYSESGEGILIHISHSIKVPDIFCSKNTIARSEACTSLIPVYSDLEALCTLFKVEGAWKNFINAEENILVFKKLSRESSYANDSSSGVTGQPNVSSLPPALDRMLQQRVAKRYIYRSTTPISYWSSGRDDMHRQTLILTEEVDRFISNGHVRVKDLDEIEQLRKLEKFRKIVIDYGFNINFQMGLWYKVVVILSGSDKEYITEQVKDRFIVIIPKKFHARSLMEHLGETIPFATLYNSQT